MILLSPGVVVILFSFVRRRASSVRKRRGARTRNPARAVAAREIWLPESFPRHLVRYRGGGGLSPFLSRPVVDFKMQFDKLIGCVVCVFLLCVSIIFSLLAAPKRGDYSVRLPGRTTRRRLSTRATAPTTFPPRNLGYVKRHGFSTFMIKVIFNQKINKKTWKKPECILGCLIAPECEELIDWLVDWAIDWLVDWLIDWLFGRLIDGLIDWLIVRLVDWLIDW